MADITTSLYYLPILHYIFNKNKNKPTVRVAFSSKVIEITSRMSEDTVNVLMVGTGEYTTGFVGGGRADSDKGAGVVALTMFDLRRRGKVDRVAMCGVNVREYF